MKTIKLSFSTLFAIGSFVIGTLLFVLYQVSKNDIILLSGCLYVLLASLFNGLLLLHLIYELLFFNQKEETFIKILILLSNIPIACLYFTLLFN